METDDAGYYRASSWTGSERQRHDRGGCAPYYRSQANESRYTVAAGTRCEISPVARLRWREYTTVKEVGFERRERYDREAKCYEFRLEGWLMRVPAGAVRHRDRGDGH